MNVLVTGAAGYIGSVLVGELLAAGHRVTALDNLMYGQTSLAAYFYNKNFTFFNVSVDTFHPGVVGEHIDGVDFILPLAAIVGAPACDKHGSLAYFVNKATIEDLCSGWLPRRIGIIYPNTNSGYGASKVAICDETTETSPLSTYAATKAAAEKAVMARGNGIALRLATVFGVSPRMRTDLLVNDFVQRACTDKALVLFEGQFRRNYIHVRDVARAFIHCIDNFDAMKNQIYNCGLSDANLSKRDLCERIKSHIPDFVYMEAPIGRDPDQRDYVVSNKKIEATGFRCEFSLDDGIRELEGFYRMTGRRHYGNV